MDRVEEYRRRAEESEDRARAAKSSTEREAYEKIAQAWRELIADVDRGRRRGY